MVETSRNYCTEFIGVNSTLSYSFFCTPSSKGRSLKEPKSSNLIGIKVFAEFYTLYWSATENHLLVCSAMEFVFASPIGAGEFEHTFRNRGDDLKRRENSLFFLSFSFLLVLDERCLQNKSRYPALSDTFIKFVYRRKNEYKRCKRKKHE